MQAVLATAGVLAFSALPYTLLTMMPLIKRLQTKEKALVAGESSFSRA